MTIVKVHRPIAAGLIVLGLTISLLVAGCGGEESPDAAQTPTTSGSSTTSQTSPAENPTTTSVGTAEIPTTVPSMSTGTELLLELARNAEITIGAGEDALSFTLVDGSYQSGQGNDPDRVKVNVTDAVTFGDLNDDGIDDAAMAIRVRQGVGGGQGSGQGSGQGKGSGNAGGDLTDERTSEYVVALLSQEGELAQAGYYALGAGGRIDSLAIEGGELTVDARLAGLEESPRQAKVLATIGLRLSRDPGPGRQLVLRSQTSVTPGGDIRKISITSPEPEAMVAGLVQVEGTITVAPFENNLVYHVYDPEMNELGVGPVTVDAADIGAPGTFVFTLDLVALGCSSWFLVTVSDLSALDGSILALDSVELLNAGVT